MSKIARIEHNVELGSVQELDKAISEGKKQIGLYSKFLGEIDAFEKEIQSKKEAMLKKAEDFRRELNNKKNQLGDTWEDFNTKAKELGIDVKGLPSFKEADSTYMELDKESREMTDIITKKFGGKF